MKKVKRLFYLGFCSFCLLLIIAAEKTQNDLKPKLFVAKGFAPVAVLELFTSQGCSSCPPADELLGRYVQKESAGIFPLSFHVDYWNNLGWKDIFSMAVFSERQKKYASVMDLPSIYTPQLVVNGVKECVGSNEKLVAGAIDEMLKQPASVSINGNATVKGNSVSVNAMFNGDFKNDVLNIAVVENKSSISVEGGENRGLTLRNYNIVRVWKILARVAGKNNFDLELPGDLSHSDAKIILYTQDKNSYKITGAAKISL